MRKTILLVVLGMVVVGILVYTSSNKAKPMLNSSTMSEMLQDSEGGLEETLHPLAIESLRQKEYPGSEIVIEQELSDSSNYKRYIASYKSDGLKIFGLLTVPKGDEPVKGWPAIIFNHGYIPPDQYVTTQRYEDYVDGFAKNGYVVFKPDYRGHGNSEGNADGNYFSPGYVVDVSNATASIKKMKDPSTGSGRVVNPTRIGMWGHSMGGNITMKNLVISDDIKAAVIWAGVVGSYDDILNNWSRAGRWRQSAEHRHQGPSRQGFIEEYGPYEENSDFWSSIDPYTFIETINTPVQIHHGTGDTHVPFSFSDKFDKNLKEAKKEVEFYSYEGADHNLSGSSFSLAMKRSIEFFDKYLK